MQFADTSFSDLPSEILNKIAAVDESTYRAMLSIPRFAKSLTPSIITDFQIAFGFTVEIMCCKIVWLRNGECHRINNPAVEWFDGSKYWCKTGRLHRDPVVDGTIGPAIEWSDGTNEWYKNGLRHRDPFADGTVGPAIEWADGSKEWYKNGKRHRDPFADGTVGPAIEWSDGIKEWWETDVFIE